jgi:hypothetical protein
VLPRPLGDPAPDEPRRARAIAVGCALFAVALSSLLAPAVVNGDGLGYLRASFGDGLAPGHLLWLPILRALAAITGADGALSLLAPARWLCWASAGAAAFALALATARLAGARAAAVAGLGLAVSFGFVEAGADVETYAPALAAAMGALACAVRARAGGSGWAAAAAILSALSALLHVENALFVPVTALIAGGGEPGGRRSGRLRAVGVAVLAGGLVALAYALAARARGDDLAGALRFVAGASHGFSYPLGPASPFIALYGVARTLVQAPYHYEAGWPRVVAQTLLGLLAASTMLRLARRPGRPRTLGRAAALAWAIPYAAVGVLFFASDSERWIFLLPGAWIAVAAGAVTSPRAARAAVVLVAALLLADVALGLPRAADRSRRDRADGVAALFTEGDLVVSPGHDWDEYVGFYSPPTVDTFPMIYFCGLLHGRAGMAAELGRRIERARASGRRVFVLRAGDREDSPGWKDLAGFGVTPAALPSLLPGRLSTVGPDVARLDP